MLNFQKRSVIVKQMKNYSESLAHCKSLGGTLALPESAEENQQIIDAAGNIMIYLVFPLFLRH